MWYNMYDEDNTLHVALPPQKELQEQYAGR